MPTTFTRTIYGLSHGITLDKFNVGALVKSVSGDLEEFGQQGVQGLVVKGSEATNLVTKNQKAKNAADLYCMAGTAKGQLVFVIRDKNKTAFESGPVTLVKDYDKIRSELAKNTGIAQDISPGVKEDLIVKSTLAHGDRVGGDSFRGEGPMDLTGITGDVVLCAHGTPKVLPGRVIGSKLGRKTPAEVVNILIGNSDPKKQLPKDYSGKVTLAGCFTASGGPEESKQDDPFAKQVHDLLVSKGYKRVSVVGMPGPAYTGGLGDGLTDSEGVSPKRGVEVVVPDLTATTNGINAIRQKIDLLTEGLIKVGEKSDNPNAFLTTPGALDVLKKIAELEKEIEVATTKLPQAYKTAGIRGLVGTFGLRQIKMKFKK